MITTLAVSGEEIAAMAVCGGLVVVVLSIILSAVRRMFETRNRELSRREIAAYVAEGSMTPDEAALLLSAGDRT